MKYEPRQKEIKIDDESVHIQMPLLLLYFSNKIVCSLSKMPKSMMIKQLNLDHSCFKFHADS